MFFRHCMNLEDEPITKLPPSDTNPTKEMTTADPQLISLLNSIVARLDAIEGKITPGPSTGASGAANLGEDVRTEVSPAVAAYEVEVLEALVYPLVSNLNGIHADGMKLSEPIKDAFVGIGPIISAAAKAKKPADVSAVVLPMLKPVQEAAGKIRKLRLPRDLDNNQRSVEEMMACLSWVLVEKTPVPFVKETLGAAEYYSNKIRREFKNKEGGESQVTFCDQLKALILGLADYIKAYHLTGLTFNPNGGEFDATLVDVAKDASPSVATRAPVSAPAPVASSPAPAVGGINMIMAELKSKQTSSGDSAATGLRKVTKDMQTWREEYKATDGTKPVASSASKVAPKAPPKQSTAPVNKPPVCKFVDIGSKWIIEYQTKDQNTSTTNNGVIKIDISDPKNQVYIFKCENVTIDVKGKCKGIVIDGCKRVNVLFDDIISVVELVNNKNVAVQTRGTVPNISIDKTAGCMVYLSKASASVTSFVTSTSSEMNVSWPNGESDDDLVEKPIPEQFLHKLIDGNITSEVSELYS